MSRFNGHVLLTPDTQREANVGTLGLTIHLRIIHLTALENPDLLQRKGGH